MIFFTNRKGLAIFETVATLCLIGVLIGVVIYQYNRVMREARDTAVKTELSNIRTGINLFKIMNNRNPESLNEMIEKSVMLPARVGSDPYSGSFFDRKYLMTNSIDAQGNLVDAFGNFFYYDPVRGEVKSSTQGCETW